ncbi:hypothetical protein KR067_001865 [Drosophila pandora]|nr:hypothetical protein KR067_001865 [Drosophila pandora]
MNRYDEALYKVVDTLLAVKECMVVDDKIRHQLVYLLRNKFHEIAVQTTNGANHAGRTSASYFDLERTFRLMGIEAADLNAVKQAYPPGRVVRCSEPQTREEDFHKGPHILLSSTSKQEMASRSHIPDYFPAFPGTHTYKTTMMEQCPNKDYVSVRIRQAENQQNLQKALNGFFLGANPSTSLFSKAKEDTRFNLLEIDASKNPSYLSALKPVNQVFETDIYETKEEITHAGTILAPK